MTNHPNRSVRFSHLQYGDNTSAPDVHFYFNHKADQYVVTILNCTSARTGIETARKACKAHIKGETTQHVVRQR